MNGPEALVLGGGFAGLAAAIELASRGVEVLLLEQEPQVGGKAGEIRASGYRFDTGPSVLTLPEVLLELLALAPGVVPPNLVPLRPLSRYLFPGGRVWDVYRDLQPTLAQLDDKEARSYRALLKEARRLYRAAAPTFVHGPAPGPAALLRFGLRHGLGAHPFRSLPRLLRRFDPGPDLERFFLRFATYFGADPYRAPAVLHNIAWVELGLGVVYPEGGTYGLVRKLEEALRSLGGRIRTGVRIEALERGGGSVTGVHAGGESWRPRVVVSTLDLVRSQRLLGRRSVPGERLEPSLSGFVLLLGIEGETPALTHHTVVFPEDYRAEFAQIAAGRFPADPTLYLNLSVRSALEDAPRGHENWFVMANAPAMGSAGGDPDGEPAYGDHLLGVLERRGLLDPGRIRYRKLLGPRHLARLAFRGAIYGAAPHSLLRTLRHGPRLAGVDNLFLGGGTVHPGGGIPLSLRSGRNAGRLAAGFLGVRRGPES